MMCYEPAYVGWQLQCTNVSEGVLLEVVENCMKVGQPHVAVSIIGIKLSWQ
jgi:hypothetical protein